MTFLVPQTIIKGDSFNMTVPLPDLEDNESWTTRTLKLVSFPDSEGTEYEYEEEQNIPAIGVENRHRFAVTSTFTNGLEPELYRYSLFLVGDDGSNPTTITIDYGVTEVVDPTSSVTKSHARKMVKLLEGVLEAKMGGGRADIYRYTIDEREIWTFSIEELRRELNRYKQDVINEKRRAGARHYERWQ